MTDENEKLNDEINQAWAPEKTYTIYVARDSLRFFKEELEELVKSEWTEKSLKRHLQHPYSKEIGLKINDFMKVIIIMRKVIPND